MFLYLPVMNEKGQFLISRIYTTNEQYTILYDTTNKFFIWPNFEVQLINYFETQLFNFLKKRANLIADPIIYLGGRDYGNIVILIYLAFCPFNSAGVKSNRYNEELIWVDLKEMPTLLHREDRFMVDILQKFCLHANIGFQVRSHAVN